ncbi:MAG: redoxin domain-containing protein [Planctomycetota bacterium]
MFKAVGCLACLLWASVSIAADDIPAEVIPAKGKHPSKLITARGEPIERPETRLTVYCFLGTECPLAKLYGPRLQALADRYADDVVFIGVNSNVQDSPAEIEAYAKRHAILFPMAKDADQSIAAKLNATRTPEVILLDTAGNIQYRGRIDDQYEPGVARSEPRSHDLQNAIDEFLAGQVVSVPVTEGVGCLITRVRANTAPDNENAIYTFNRDIAPILNQHCVECHRQGEIGPFELTEYDEVIGWADMILEVIDQRRMPPWHADPEVGEFVGARQMPTEARSKIARWIEDGMPQGDATDLPEPPRFLTGWHLESEPDLEIPMRSRPFTVPADGTVEYQYFVVDPEWETDRWVRAAQVIPGNASVVHHTIVFVRPPDGQSFAGIGWLGAYVPGQRAFALPPGHARRIPAGSKLVFQMHYTPNGTVTEDRTRLGVWFAAEEDVTHQVTTHVAINHEFEIPPGAEDYQVELSANSFPHTGKLMGITPHMHFRGKSFQLFATHKTDETRNIDKAEQSKTEWLRVPQYDFNWQHWYAFAEAMPLTEIESLEMRVGFDNSRGNPFNPDPNEYVSWGDQTWEEMAVAFFDVATARGTPLYRRPTIANPDESELAKLRAKAEAKADKFFAEMDTNGDGVIERDETPETFRLFGFNRIDHNRDRRITRQEVLEEASYRD